MHRSVAPASPVWPPMPLVVFEHNNMPFIGIPPPALPALISLNRSAIMDRKMRRKAETHKTIPCRAWNDTGRCNYGNRCKFAHGDDDLRKVPEEPVKVFNNPRYRTAPCLKYRLLGHCPYGDRCSYIHDPVPKVDIEQCLERLSLSPSSSPAPSTGTLESEDGSWQSWSSGRTSAVSVDPFLTEDSCKETIEFPRVQAFESVLQKPFSFS